MESKSVELVVRQIIKTEGDYSQVVVSNDVFKSVAGLRPLLPYTTGRDSAGHGIRVFDFGGVKLYTRRDKEASKTYFIVHKDTASKCLRTLVDERSGEVPLPFAI